MNAEKTRDEQAQAFAVQVERLIKRAGLSRMDAMILLKVDDNTLRRWRSGKVLPGEQRRSDVLAVLKAAGKDRT